AETELFADLFQMGGGGRARNQKSSQPYQQSKMHCVTVAFRNGFAELAEGKGRVAYWDGICKCVSALPAGNFPEAHCSVHLIENSCALGYKLPCPLIF